MKDYGNLIHISVRETKCLCLTLAFICVKIILGRTRLVPRCAHRSTPRKNYCQHKHLKQSHHLSSGILACRSAFFK
jgi:hypothetical protein